MERLADAYARLLSIVIAVFLMGMVVLVLGNVVLRYAFNSGITVSEEISRWLFVWITFLGGIVALRERAHLGTDALVSRVSIPVRKALLFVGHVIILGVCVLIFKGSLEQTTINLSVLAPSTQLPVAIVYAAGLVFSASAALLLLLDLWQLVNGRLADDRLVMIRETEEALPPSVGAVPVPPSRG